MISLPKYPRTEHVLSSKKTNILPLEELQKLLTPGYGYEVPCIAEEKIDGSSVAIGFEKGKPYFFHRNSPAVGPEFDLLKSWVSEIETELYLALGERYIMYGEWLYYCHTIVYNQLPSFFIEYDIYDKDKDFFLDTFHRYLLIQETGINSVVHCDLNNCIYTDYLTERQQNFYFPAHLRNSEVGCRNQEQVLSDWDRARKEYHPIRLAQSYYSDPVEEDLDRDYPDHYTVRSGMMEGLYLKIEDEGRVLQRYKFIRQDFIDTVLKSNHWSKRYPPILNKLSAK